MSELNKIRLNKVLREFNISLERVVEFLSSNGHEIEARPTTKISQIQYDLLLNEFSSDRSSKVESHDLSEEKKKEKEEIRIQAEKERELKIQRQTITSKSSIQQFKKVGEIDLNKSNIVNEKLEKAKEEKRIKLWKQLLPYVLSISLGIVIFTSGYVFWENYSKKSNQRLGDDFTAAVQLLNEDDLDAALIALDRIVDKGSDGTLANMSSKSLLLSNKARVNSKPELEILADDVRCSHGVTIGNLSLEQMFYLRSRGISEVEARKLLVSSFGNIIIDDLNKNFIDRAQKMMSDYFNE